MTSEINAKFFELINREKNFFKLTNIRQARNWSGLYYLVCVIIALNVLVLLNNAEHEGRRVGMVFL